MSAFVEIGVLTFVTVAVSGLAVIGVAARALRTRDAETRQALEAMTPQVTPVQLDWRPAPHTPLVRPIWDDDPRGPRVRIEHRVVVDSHAHRLIVTWDHAAAPRDLDEARKRLGPRQRALVQHTLDQGMEVGADGQGVMLEIRDSAGAQSVRRGLRALLDGVALLLGTQDEVMRWLSAAVRAGTAFDPPGREEDVATWCAWLALLDPDDVDAPALAARALPVVHPWLRIHCAALLGDAHAPTLGAIAADAGVDHAHRRLAIAELARCGDGARPTALGLFAYLPHHDLAAYARTLGGLGDTPGPAWLMEIAQVTPPGARAAALTEGLARIGSAQAEALLQAWLSHGHPEVLAAAADALLALGVEGVEEAVLAHLDAPQGLAALRWLARHGGHRSLLRLQRRGPPHAYVAAEQARTIEQIRERVGLASRGGVSVALDDDAGRLSIAATSERGGLSRADDPPR